MISVSTTHLDVNKLTGFGIELEIRLTIDPSLASIAVEVSAYNNSSWSQLNYENWVKLTIGLGCSGGGGSRNMAPSCSRRGLMGKEGRC